MSDIFGDYMSPALKQDADGFYSAVDHANLISAKGAGPISPQNFAANLSQSFKNKASDPPPTTCKQKIWFSFFFDGTGNNMDADIGTLKHSNVARLYRVHEGIDPAKQKGTESPTGVYRLYIPGVGTYFRDVGDPGGTTLGGGSGDMGEERLNWAKDRFYDGIMPHLKKARTPQNEITEINIAAFGFSRGAALARAFIQRFYKKECKKNRDGILVLKEGEHKVILKFMGIFDTVASVGLPLSTNNTSVVSMLGSLWLTTRMRLNESDPAIGPIELAFEKKGQAGTDPAPGKFNGHQSWGGEMAIPKEVEEVRHFVAAHEIRNSFPLDSVSVFEHGRITKESNFYESVYPGVHSDVGGSYRPGEEGKSAKPEDKIGLIVGNDMYNAGLAKGVPFKPRANWTEDNRNDFKVSQKTVDVYNYYLSKTSAAGNLGDLFNSNMALLFAWRFQAIRKKRAGDTTESQNIKKSEDQYKTENNQLDSEIANYEKQRDKASIDEMNISMDRSSYQSAHQLGYDAPTPYDQADMAAKQKIATADDNMYRARAKKDAEPSTGKLESAIKFYDDRLMKDAESIYSAYKAPFWSNDRIDAEKRAQLRPHYKALMDAYENEFILNKGLTDQKIIDFFDNYVHDSLAGFAKDATFPSDPRVIYLGGEQKYKYASLDEKQSGNHALAA